MDRRGATTAEYAIIVGLVALVALGGYRCLGDAAHDAATRETRCIAEGVCGAQEPLSGVAAQAPAGAASAEKKNPIVELLEGAGDRLKDTWVPWVVGVGAGVLVTAVVVAAIPAAAPVLVVAGIALTAYSLGSIAYEAYQHPPESARDWGAIAVDVGETLLPVPSFKGASALGKKIPGLGRGAVHVPEPHVAPNCFAAGTPVVGVDGPRPIETIAAGDLVLARDPETGETSFRRVARTFATADRDVVDVGVARADGVREDFVVTTEHPFFVVGRGFVKANDLSPGDRIATSTGDERIVRLFSLPERTTVFNFEVEYAHTYFVGATQAWVHNDCGPPSPALKGSPYHPDTVADRSATAQKTYDPHTGPAARPLGAADLPTAPRSSREPGRIYFDPPRNWSGRPNRSGAYVDAKGREFTPPRVGDQHGGAHWDVVDIDGRHYNVFPDGRIR